MPRDENGQNRSSQPVHGIKEKMSVEGEGRVVETDSSFRFGRLFSLANEHAVVLKLSTCAAIGESMTAPSPQARKDSEIPAGYTYLGQFIDHDMTSDATESEGSEGDDPNTDVVEPTSDGDLLQKRSPTLDLDSLYGSAVGHSPRFFDGPNFRLGRTSAPSTGAGHSGKSLPYDLPRSMKTRPGEAAREAQIGDPRNDENLAVAQTHLLWLRFHNHIANALKQANPSASDALIIEQARDLVTRHYQWIVLHDFVVRFVQKDVFEDVVIQGNRKLMHHGPGEVAFMPLEFSVAAYRHGHSQVRESYDWNVNFGPEGAVAGSPFRRLFDFSQVSGNFFGNPTLPSNWIPDFRRLYDFGDTSFPHLQGGQEGNLNFAKAIDPYLASDLGNLPEIQMLVDMGLRPFANLAALNLRRGSMRALPSGQAVSRAMSEVRMLSVAEMKSVLDEDFIAAMESTGLFERTPLWLYILLEAAVRGEGNCLGEMGSRIVAETFFTLVLTSRTSILHPKERWHPQDSLAKLSNGNSLETMADILLWIDANEPIIDPLQDSRLDDQLSVAT